MGAEILLFLTWFATLCKTVFLFLITTGTNDALVSLILKNILLFSILVIVTPNQWDDSLWDKIKRMIASFNNKDGDEK